jgi:hypothetical protein
MAFTQADIEAYALAAGVPKGQLTPAVRAQFEADMIAAAELANPPVTLTVPQALIDAINRSGAALERIAAAAEAMQASLPASQTAMDAMVTAGKAMAGDVASLLALQKPAA